MTSKCTQIQPSSDVRHGRSLRADSRLALPHGPPEPFRADICQRTRSRGRIHIGPENFRKPDAEERKCCDCSFQRVAEQSSAEKLGAVINCRRESNTNDWPFLKEIHTEIHCCVVTFLKLRMTSIVARQFVSTACLISPSVSREMKGYRYALRN